MNSLQEAGVRYLSCKEILAKVKRSRSMLFYDIKSGRLPAIWGMSDDKSRAWLVHPKDAGPYIAKYSNENL